MIYYVLDMAYTVCAELKELINSDTQPDVLNYVAKWEKLLEGICDEYFHQMKLVSVNSYLTIYFFLNRLGPNVETICV